jgi:hypothetical protein
MSMKHSRLIRRVAAASGVLGLAALNNLSHMASSEGASPRTAQSKRLASDKEVVEMAEIISCLVDLSHLHNDEKIETLIFSVSKVMDALVTELPTPYATLAHKAGGLKEETSLELQGRLGSYLRTPLPFLTVHEEALVVKLVISFICGSMRDGCSLEEILKPNNADIVVLSAMLEGLRQSLDDPEKRSRIFRAACAQSDSTLPHWLLGQFLEISLPDILQFTDLAVRESHVLHQRHRISRLTFPPSKVTEGPMANASDPGGCDNVQEVASSGKERTKSQLQ